MTDRDHLPKEAHSFRCEDDAAMLACMGRPTSVDLYAYRHRVRGLLWLLENCALPFVVSVEGEWGPGKSSLIEMLVDELRPANRPKASTKTWHIVKYCPWRYDLRDYDDVWESIVEVIAYGLCDPGTPYNELPDFVRPLLDQLRDKRLSRFLRNTAFSISDLLLRGLSSNLKQLFDDQRCNRPFAVFDEIRRSLYKLPENVLLIVDDLDRCEPSALANVLRATATLFAPIDNTPRPLFFVMLAMDRNIAEKAMINQLGWEQSYVSGFLDKIINVHVTLPFLDVGSGDSAAATKQITERITGSGQRRERQVTVTATNHSNTLTVQFTFPEERVRVIRRFMHFNPREIERFCLLFDLKWHSRFEDNARAHSCANEDGFDKEQFQARVDHFRDLLIFQT